MDNGDDDLTDSSEESFFDYEEYDKESTISEESIHEDELESILHNMGTSTPMKW